MAQGEYTINDLYQGGVSSFDPSYGDIFTGYHVPASQLGAPTKPDTANQIQQVNALLNQGIVPIEVGTISPEVFDQIPKQQFKEIQRMADLTGTDMSVHAPIVEASGIGEQGWSEAERQLAENQLIGVVDRTAPMNKKGGMSITIHGAGKIPGAEYRMTPEGKKEEAALYVVNKETGKVTTVLSGEEKIYPGQEGEIKAIPYTPRQELDSLNNTEWQNTLSQLMHHKVDSDSRIREIEEGSISLKEFKKAQEAGDLERQRQLAERSRRAMLAISPTQQFLHDAHTTLNGMFHKAYKFGTDEDKAKLAKANKEFTKLIKDSKKAEKEQRIADMLSLESQAIGNLVEELKRMPPEVYQPVEDFAVDKSAQTFANVAFHALKKYGDKAPSINIENLFPGMAFSHGKELDNLITKTKQQFVEKAVGKGYSKSKAEEQADKIIGITLDVGHLNIAKKKGFKDKDLLKEVEQIAKHVKHVHLTDNFGYSDSHLPPGMGNVPVKEILERLEKEGYEGKKIVEAGGFVQHFGTSPLPYTLRGLGAPIFTGEQESPYWNQTQGLYQGYSTGIQGAWFPQTHYETFGAGFSQLPSELGGERAGAKGSRMSGRGME